jgi:hypothetical protein
LFLCYVNAHVDVINTAIDMSAHWLLDVIAADQLHEFFTGVRLLIFALNGSLHEAVCILVPVDGFRSFGVMLWAQEYGEAIGFADRAQALAKINMMPVKDPVDCIIAMSMHAQPAMSVFLLHDAGGMSLAFLFGLCLRVFNHIRDMRPFLPRSVGNILVSSLLRC